MRPFPKSLWAFAAILSFGQSAGAQESHCFTADQRPNFQVIEQAPPPRADGVDYAYYPASVVASMRLDLLQTSKASMPMYFWHWANHGPRRVPKSNLTIGVHPGSGTEIFFSSKARADACTMAQAAGLFSDEAEVSQVVGNAGLQRQTEASPGTFTDVCIVPKDQLPARAAGILIDYEVADGRSSDETRQFLVNYANYVHSKGKKVILYTNPLDAPSQRMTGVTASNASALMDAFDLMSITLWSRSRQGDIVASFESQKAMFRSWQPEKVLVNFELNGTTVRDAAETARIMKENSIESVSFWRDYAKQGGSCSEPVNHKIACLAFGRC